MLTTLQLLSPDTSHFGPSILKVSATSKTVYICERQPPLSTHITANCCKLHLIFSFIMRINLRVMKSSHHTHIAVIDSKKLTTAIWWEHHESDMNRHIHHGDSVCGKTDGPQTYRQKLRKETKHGWKHTHSPPQSAMDGLWSTKSLVCGDVSVSLKVVTIPYVGCLHTKQQHYGWPMWNK